MDTVIVKVNSDMNFPCSVMSIQDIQVKIFQKQCVGVPQWIGVLLKLVENVISADHIMHNVQNVFKKTSPVNTFKKFVRHGE